MQPLAKGIGEHAAYVYADAFRMPDKGMEMLLELFGHCVGIGTHV
jgi:hypothetical protein